jgi:DNA-binding CsgD family transcriptional regulator
MAKPPNQPKNKKAQKPFYQSDEWRAQYRNGYSEVEIHDGAANIWSTVMHVQGKHHLEIADFTVAVINAHNQKIDKYEEAIRALEICLESDGLSWEAEQAADIVLGRSEKDTAPIIDNKVLLPVKKLTPRELEVLAHTACGRNRNDIAQILCISEETVKVYVERICSKLRADNKTHAAIIALSLGLIEPCEFSDLEIIKRSDFVPHTGNAPAQKISVLPAHVSKRK